MLGCRVELVFWVYGLLSDGFTFLLPTLTVTMMVTFMMLLFAFVLGVLRLVPDFSSAIQTGSVYGNSCQSSSHFSSCVTAIILFLRSRLF